MCQKKMMCLFVVISLVACLLAEAADIEKGLFLYLPIDEGAGVKVKDYGPKKFKTEMSKKTAEVGRW